MPKTCNCDPHFAAQRDNFFRHLNLESVCAWRSESCALWWLFKRFSVLYVCWDRWSEWTIEDAECKHFFKDDIGVDKDPIECPQLRRVARGWGELWTLKGKDIWHELHMIHIENIWIEHEGHHMIVWSVPEVKPNCIQFSLPQINRYHDWFLQYLRWGPWSEWTTENAECKQLSFQRWDCVDAWFPPHFSFK
jgi:hypothetical protein